MRFPVVERLVNPASAPPLLTWLISGSIVAVVVTCLWFWINSEEVLIKPLLEPCLTASTPKLSVSKPSIVALGTSLLIYSTEPTKKFQSYLNDKSWISCPVSLGLWRDLVRELPTIVALKPKILLLHEGVLTDFSFQNRYDIQKLFAKVFAKIRVGLGWPRPQPQPQPDLHLDRPPCGPGKPLHANTYDAILKPQGAIFTEATTWIRRLEAAGTHVIVLDIPRSATLESQIGSVLVERRMALQKLAYDSGAEYWAFAPPPGPQSYCVDEAHMALDGRNQFAPQLAKRLQDNFASGSK